MLNVSTVYPILKVQYSTLVEIENDNYLFVESLVVVVILVF